MATLEDFIAADFAPFTPQTLVQDAEDFMLYHNFTHFPVVHEGVYWGAVALNDLQTSNMEATLADVRYAWTSFYIRSEATWLDVLETASRNQAQLLPVLNRQNQYIGYVESEQILAFFNEQTFLNEQGQTLVVAKATANYTLSQVSQIAEGAGAHLLGVWTHFIDATRTEITLKLRLGNLAEVIAAFRRYEYEIVTEHDQDSYLEKLRERSDYLDKYLNI